MKRSVGQRIRRGLRRRLPIVTWLPVYKRARLRPDIVAGVVVAALAVPQSLGYAAIAGVPVQVGLYAVPIALLVYAALGSSPQLIVGPVSTVSVLSATLVASMHPANVAQAVTYTSAIALAAGAVLVLAGFLRVGWVAEFLSKPIVTGFVFGLTILVIIGELPNLLGIHVTPGDVLHRISALALNIDQVDLLTATVGVSALAVLFTQPACATDLLDAWRAAERNDLELRSARAAHGTGEARREQAASLWRPTLQFSGTAGRASSNTATRGAQFSAPGFGQ